ncbi:hypothetical protein BJY52DRAFT_1228442 [Lactarius psammicola]|nr:hypothetical protein BJY52DRAFT_1228442 [Lactarius psammicola]
MSTYRLAIPCLSVFSTSASCCNTTFHLHFHSPHVVQFNNPKSGYSHPHAVLPVSKSLYRRPRMLPVSEYGGLIFQLVELVGLSTNEVDRLGVRVSPLVTRHMGVQKWRWWEESYGTVAIGEAPAYRSRLEVLLASSSTIHPLNVRRSALWVHNRPILRATPRLDSKPNRYDHYLTHSNLSKAAPPRLTGSGLFTLFMNFHIPPPQDAIVTVNLGFPGPPLFVAKLSPGSTFGDRACGDLPLPAPGFLS